MQDTINMNEIPENDLRRYTDPALLLEEVLDGKVKPPVMFYDGYTRVRVTQESWEWFVKGLKVACMMPMKEKKEVKEVFPQGKPPAGKGARAVKWVEGMGRKGLTMDQIEAFKTKRGGYTELTIMRLSGERIPKSGWKRRAVGKILSEEVLKEIFNDIKRCDNKKRV